MLDSITRFVMYADFFILNQIVGNNFKEYNQGVKQFECRFCLTFCGTFC